MLAAFDVGILSACSFAPDYIMGTKRIESGQHVRAPAHGPRLALVSPLAVGLGFGRYETFATITSLVGLAAVKHEFASGGLA